MIRADAIKARDMVLIICGSVVVRSVTQIGGLWLGFLCLAEYVLQNEKHCLACC